MTWQILVQGRCGVYIGHAWSLKRLDRNV